MKVFKDIFFGLVLVLLAVTTVRAESNEIPITPAETLSSLLFPNNQRSFFFLTASNENVESNDFYDYSKISTQAQEDSRLKNLKRWYEATTHSSSTFAVGFYPYGVTFDGANIWVSNSGSNSLTKLRANDGALIGTYAVGPLPRGIVFDGTNIWVANSGSNRITKLRASDGTILGTYAVGFYPDGVAFDGANIWVANSGSNNVTKLMCSALMPWATTQ